MLKKKERRVPIGKRLDQQEYPRLSFQQALDFVMNAKRAEGLRERTLKDYQKHYGYFINWINEKYPEIEYVDELTSTLFRDHINFMRYDAKRYRGHKYIDEDKQRIGLTDTTVNIRLRTLKAIFNQLRRDILIDVNPVENVNLPGEISTDSKVWEICYPIEFYNQMIDNALENIRNTTILILSKVLVLCG